MNQLIGSQVKQYQINSELESGGMGTVYLATDTKLGRDVALKVMHPHLARQSEFQKRFHLEAQAAARLDHPSIVAVHDFGIVGELFFIVMAYVPGTNLLAHIQLMQAQNQVVQLRESLFALAQVADALGYAHRRKVIHRDVKPDNILLRTLAASDRAGEPPLRAIVTDFGLARLESNGLTQAGTFMGTLPYMSPEQCLGETDLDGRSDIYALGIILYQLTTGQLPFRITSPTDAIRKHLHEKLPPPTIIKPGLPPSIENIIVTATAKKPETRYQTATEMARDLRQAMSHLNKGDIIRYAPQETTHSLLTQIESVGAMSKYWQMDNIPAQPAPVDQLIVARKGEDPQFISLTKQTLVIGRSDQNDIVLKASGISKRHAQLEKTNNGWQITDRNSRNGVYLGPKRLLAEVPEAWPPEQTVRIGRYFLRWQSAQLVSQNTFVRRDTSPLTLPAGGSQIISPDGQLNVVVHPTSLEVAANDQASLQIELHNLGYIVDHFYLSLNGLPDAWYTLTSTSTQLMPDEQTTFTVAIHPPKASSTVAQTYPFQIQVHSEAHPNKIAKASGQLTIIAYEQFTMKFHPSRLHAGDSTRVSIQNQGNAATTFRLVGRDPANAILFPNQGTAAAWPW